MRVSRLMLVTLRKVQQMQKLRRISCFCVVDLSDESVRGSTPISR